MFSRSRAVGIQIALCSDSHVLGSTVKSFLCHIQAVQALYLRLRVSLLLNIDLAQTYSKDEGS